MEHRIHQQGRERFARIQKLRAEGLELWAIAERLGMTEDEIKHNEAEHRRSARLRAAKERS